MQASVSTPLSATTQARVTRGFERPSLSVVNVLGSVFVHFEGRVVEVDHYWSILAARICSSTSLPALMCHSLKVVLYSLNLVYGVSDGG